MMHMYEPRTPGTTRAVFNAIITTCRPPPPPQRAEDKERCTSEVTGFMKQHEPLDEDLGVTVIIDLFFKHPKGRQSRGVARCHRQHPRYVPSSP